MLSFRSGFLRFPLPFSLFLSLSLRVPLSYRSSLAHRFDTLAYRLYSPPVATSFPSPLLCRWSVREREPVSRDALLMADAGVSSLLLLFLLLLFSFFFPAMRPFFARRVRFIHRRHYRSGIHGRCRSSKLQKDREREFAARLLAAIIISSAGEKKEEAHVPRRECSQTLFSSSSRERERERRREAERERERERERQGESNRIESNRRIEDRKSFRSLSERSSRARARLSRRFSEIPSEICCSSPRHSIRMYRVSLAQWSLRKVLRPQRDCSTCASDEPIICPISFVTPGGIHLTGCVGWKRDACFLSPPDPANKILSFSSEGPASPLFVSFSFRPVVVDGVAAVEAGSSTGPSLVLASSISEGAQLSATIKFARDFGGP